MVRRNVSILCVQETKWVSEKARIKEPWGYKLWYIGRYRNRNEQASGVCFAPVSSPIHAVFEAIFSQLILLLFQDFVGEFQHSSMDISRGILEEICTWA